MYFTVDESEKKLEIHMLLYTITHLEKKDFLEKSNFYDGNGQLKNSIYLVKRQLYNKRRTTNRTKETKK